jgi:hypothetical protein
MSKRPATRDAFLCATSRTDTLARTARARRFLRRICPTSKWLVFNEFGTSPKERHYSTT